MFTECTSLTSAPELPATTLAEGCYSSMFAECTKLSTVTMLAPSAQILGNSNCCYDWLYNAGTDTNIKSCTLKVQDRDAYNALVTKELAENWKIGSNCTILDKYGNEITKQ